MIFTIPDGGRTGEDRVPCAGGPPVGHRVTIDVSQVVHCPCGSVKVLNAPISPVPKDGKQLREAKSIDKLTRDQETNPTNQIAHKMRRFCAKIY